MKINNFKGELTDISAKIEALTLRSVSSMSMSSTNRNVAALCAITVPKWRGRRLCSRAGVPGDSSRFGLDRTSPPNVSWCSMNFLNCLQPVIPLSFPYQSAHQWHCSSQYIGLINLMKMYLLVQEFYSKASFIQTAWFIVFRPDYGISGIS